MDKPVAFLDQLDQLCQQIATAIQHSELQIYAILAVIVLAAFQHASRSGRVALHTC